MPNFYSGMEYRGCWRRRQQQQQFAELLAGAFFVEYIFGWIGIGKVTDETLEKLDYR